MGVFTYLPIICMFVNILPNEYAFRQTVFVTACCRPPREGVD